MSLPGTNLPIRNVRFHGESWRVSGRATEIAKATFMTRCCHSAIDFAVMHSSVLAQRCGTIGREGPSWMLSTGARLAACPATDEICG